MPDKRVHFTREPYAPRAACQWSDNQNWTTTTDISEVTCHRCLSSIIPARFRTLTLEELRERAINHQDWK